MEGKSTLFDKYVTTDGTAPLKNGINILFLSDYNIAGNYTYMMDAVNKYTPHKARCIILHDDQFQYGKDILVDELNKDYTEMTKLVEEADFYFFGRFIFNWKGIDWGTILNNKNSLIKYHGSYLRENHQKHNLAQMHLETHCPAMTCMDWTMVPKLAGSFYHVDPFFTRFGDVDRRNIPTCKEWKGEGPLLIHGGSGKGGHGMKGYGVLHETVAKLNKNGYNVQAVTTHELTNEKFIQDKINSHVNFSGLFGGGWGTSGVESMFLGQPVLSTLTPWIMSLYPDAPAIHVTKETLYDTIKTLYKGPTSWSWHSRRHEDFAHKYFTTKTLLKKTLYLIDLIRESDKYEAGVYGLQRTYDF